jgi:hypothetical protein
VLASMIPKDQKNITALKFEVSQLQKNKTMILKLDSNYKMPISTLHNILGIKIF